MDDQELKLERAEQLFPQSMWLRFRQAFTPKGIIFFEFYALLKKIELGMPVPADLKEQYRQAANRLAQVTSPVDKRSLSPAVINAVADSRTTLSPLFARLETGRVDDASIWARINNIMVPLIIQVAADKSVYLKATQTGNRRWGLFRKMRPDQERVEKLKDDNPEDYALMVKYKKTIEEIQNGLEEKIKSAGLEVRKKFIMGRPVYFGVDPTTQEEVVFDTDGDVLTPDDYIAKRVKKFEADRKLADSPSKMRVPLSQMRKLTEEEVDQLGGDIEMVAMTDDKAKQGRLTRIYPVKKKAIFINDPEEGTRVEKYNVIVGGRFKGTYLDDIVNHQGRMVEGVAHKFNPMTGRTDKTVLTTDTAMQEPYVTVADVVTKKRVKGQVVTTSTQKLFVSIPGSKEYIDLRQAIKKMACNTGTKRGCIPSIVYNAVEGSRAASFYFDPKDFGLIMDTLKGMALSSAAVDLVKDYYKNLARAEQATADENLTMYSAENLGGFKRNRTLLTTQKKALAWMDANGNSGVCALDTGVGKTATSIAMMQKLTRDGLADGDASYTKPDGTEVTTNGLFLYVCPNSLKGNLPKEIRGFLSDEAPGAEKVASAGSPQKTLLERVDVISYQEFSGSSKSKKVPRSISGKPFWKGRKWDPSLYVALFFDEGHKLQNITSGASQAALKLWHPRKIVLTASPMEKEPMEAYVLAAVTNNTQLFGTSEGAKKNRQEMRRFKERFCEVIGGRIVGVKQDPLVKRDLNVWVKRNVFYADKRDVEEFNLPHLRAETLSVEMPAVVEDTYRAVTGQFAKMIGGMVAKFKMKGQGPKDGPRATDPEVEKAFSLMFRPIMKLLNDMANNPAQALEDLATMRETGNMPIPGPDGQPRPIPASLQRILDKMPKVSPDVLRQQAQAVGNPKLDAASDVIKAKLDRTDGSARTLLFADDKKLCMEAAQHLAKKVAGKHVVALNDQIFIFDGGGQVKEIVLEIDRGVLTKLVKSPEEQEHILQDTGGVSRHQLPFTRRAMRKFPELPASPADNTHYKADNWQQFVFKEIVQPDRSIRTCTLHGPTYQYGFNLQAFNTVVHLDRDNWNSEAMKQRTARAWRQGQSQPVDEITVDATYRATDDGVPRSEFDATLDEIRRYFQQMESDIFDRIISDAQTTDLGSEWAAMKKQDASLRRLDPKVKELMLSPYVGRSEPTGA